MSEAIFSEISKKAGRLTEEDIEKWVLPTILDAYDGKLKNLAYKVYGNNNEVPDLAVAAFKESAKSELKTAIHTFIFKKQHWRNGRELDPYLRLCLNRLAQRRTWETNSVKIKHIPVCPICREQGRKEALHVESGMLRCPNCTSISERLFDDIKANKADALLQCKYNVHSKFALHSKKGYKCPECARFLPVSLSNNGKIICPYNDCLFSGEEKSLDTCSHPIVTFEDNTSKSIGSASNAENNKTAQAFTDLGSSADVYYDVKSQFDNEHSILLSVIEEQLEKVKRTNSKSTVMQKTLMYKAYRKMLEKHPIDMVAYLVHRQQKTDFPIQARIFQTYVELVENHMPFTIIKRGEEIDIVDVTNPDLALFNGISEFQAKVNKNNIIPNNTKEEYIGGRSFKNYGPCFIGKVINVIDLNTGHSLMDKISNYSFSQIKMNEDVVPGTPVKVIHFRILSHYEMDSLVFLQRTRRDIVDSVHFRLNNKKRVVGK